LKDAGPPAKPAGSAPGGERAARAAFQARRHEDRQVVAEPLREGSDALDVEADRRREVVVPAEEAVPRVRAGVAETQLESLRPDVLAEVLREHGVVVVPHHEGREIRPEVAQLGERRPDLLAPKRIA